MSQKEKPIKKIYRLLKDFTFDELKTLFSYLGFEVENKGKTSGSRIKFYNEKLQMQYLAHKPHPSSVMKEKALKDILNYLTKNQLI